jgi:3',5'-cyclic AMP phosphodiesterase CpdA
MKNVYVLPTDKPSRLYKIRLTQNLQLLEKKYLKSSDSLVITQNIYITSDKEIKDERLRWIIDNREGMNGFIHQVSVILDSKICPEIILTTDQDLILDGVQAIDDEFLEWFVNNPSCEEVKIGQGYFKNNYEQSLKIIIPTSL